MLKWFIQISVFIVLTSVCHSQMIFDEAQDSIFYYYGKNNYTKALEFSYKALEIAGKDFGELNWRYVLAIRHIFFLQKKTNNSFDKVLIIYIGELDPEKIEGGLYNRKNCFENYLKDIMEWTGIKKDLSVVKREIQDLWDSLRNEESEESMRDKAVLADKEGDFEQIIFYLEKAKNRIKIEKGKDNEENILILNILTTKYLESCNIEKAGINAIEALSLSRKILKTNHPDFAASINNMAMYYNDRGDYKKAEPLLIEALEMRRRFFKTDCPELAKSINNIAVFYNGRGDFSKAEPLYIEALEMTRRIFKADHPDLAVSINNMANFYDGRGDYSKAEPLYIEALDMRRRIFKTDHPDLAMSINNIAAFYNARCDYKKAESLLIEALDMRRRIFKTDHPDLAGSISNMAGFYDGRGDFSKAEPLYIEALDMRRRIFKTDHPDLANSINNMAAFFKGRGDYTKAEQLYIEALEMSRRIFKTDHPDLAGSINNMALFYNDRGDYSKAEPLYIEALEMSRRIFKTDHPDLAGSINNIAVFYNGRGDFSKAEPLYIEALEMTRRIFKTDHPDLAQSINNMAGFFNDRGDYKKAEPLYIEALEMSRRIFKTEHPDLAASINNMANFHNDRGDYNKAESLFIEALEMYRRIFKTDHPDLARSNNSMAHFYDGRGDYKKAEQLYIEALDMRRRIFKTDHPDLANSINNMANFYNARGDYSKAEPLFIEVLEMNSRIFNSNHPDLATSINSMAMFYNGRGDYKKAEPLFIEALDMRRRIFKTDHPYLAESINNIAGFYHVIGDFSKAEPLFIEALDMRRRIFKTDHPDLANSINNMASFFKGRGDYKKAEPLLIEALDMRRRIFKTDHQDLAESINNMAVFYDGMGDYSKAEPLLIEALEMKRRIFTTDHPDLAGSINNMAYFYNVMGDFSKAELLLIEALDMRRRIFKTVHTDLVESINNMAAFYDDRGDYKKAEPLYIEALEMNKNIFSGQSVFLSESEKEKFWNTMNYNFIFFHSFVVKRYFENASLKNLGFDNLLFTKGILASSTNKMKEIVSNCGDISVINEFKKWYGLKQMIAKFSSEPVSELQKKKINLDSLEKSANNIEKYLSFRSEEFKKAVDKKQYTWQNIRDSLKPGEVAIEITRFNYYDKRWTDSVFYGVYILLPIDGTKLDKISNPIKFVLLKNGNEIEDINIKLYQKATKFKDNYPFVENSLKELYNAFWYPIQKELKGVSKVFLSVDGVYNKINLNTLINPETGKFLSDEIDIQLVTSTRDIVEKKKEKITNKLAATLIGDPDYNIEMDKFTELASAEQGNVLRSDYYFDRALDSIERGAINRLPNTRVEVNKIESLLKNNGWNVEKYLDTNALEETVKKQRNPRVLHIATHGKFLKDVEIQYSERMGFETNRVYENPLLRSFLLFTGSANKLSGNFKQKGKTEIDDGLLTAYEAQNLYLDETELVVLSACETGLGEIKNGEGVYGLQRAFIQAGAKSLIMSLWTVPDEPTQELMVSFYEKWLSGKTKRQAFKEAQNEMKEKYRFPVYWGGFIMLGE